jgi:hypothetical protein
MKMKLVAASVACVVAAGTLFSTTARAYALLGYSWASPVVPYYINPANMDLPTSVPRTLDADQRDDVSVNLDL